MDPATASLLWLQGDEMDFASVPCQSKSPRSLPAETSQQPPGLFSPSNKDSFSYNRDLFKCTLIDSTLLQKPSCVGAETWF